MLLYISLLNMLNMGQKMGHAAYSLVYLLFFSAKLFQSYLIIRFVLSLYGVRADGILLSIYNYFAL